MILQPSSEGWNVFSTGNYEWTGMFLWLCGIVALILAAILLVDYINNRKTSHLLWAAAFGALVWVLIMVINGSWELIINPGFGGTDFTLRCLERRVERSPGTLCLLQQYG